MHTHLLGEGKSNMADDINPDRRAELLAQKAVLEPIIRGLHDDVLTLTSPELKAQFQGQIEWYEARRDLLDHELAGMDAANAQHAALVAHGYPDLPDVRLDERLWEELQRENADRVAAAAIFKLDQATNMAINLGDPVPRTKA
jgi:hypothetical protein